MFMDGQQEVELLEIESLGIDYLGRQLFEGEQGSNRNHPYGVFLMTREGQLYLISRCVDLVTALAECDRILTKYKKHGCDWNVYLSDGCKIILQCTFMAGRDWSANWMGISLRAADDDEYYDDEDEE
jgi:hypothetical protein